MERKTCCMTESCRPAVNMERFPVAMAYVPWQHYHTTYDLCQAFAQGTIFRNWIVRSVGEGGADDACDAL